MALDSGRGWEREEGGHFSEGGNRPDFQKLKVKVEHGLNVDKKFFRLLYLL